MEEPIEDRLNTDDEVKALLLAQQIIAKVVEEKTSIAVCQAAFSSAWITTCRAAEAPPELFEEMTKGLAQLYKTHWEESHASASN